MIGENIRQARLAQDRSLADVAKKAKISVATLSRIETEKQTLELGLFLTISRILDRTPQDLLGHTDEAAGNAVDPFVRKFTAFQAGERTQFWRELTVAQRSQRTKTRRIQVHHLADQVEELLAQIDFMREELENVRKRLRVSGNGR